MLSALRTTTIGLALAASSLGGLVATAAPAGAAAPAPRPSITIRVQSDSSANVRLVAITAANTVKVRNVKDRDTSGPNRGIAEFRNLPNGRQYIEWEVWRFTTTYISCNNDDFTAGNGFVNVRVAPGQHVVCDINVADNWK